MDRALIEEIDTVVASGKAVMNGDDRDIVDIVKEAIKTDKSASFYLTRAQANAIREWYWTPERIQLTGIEPISAEENERIRTELGINVTNFRYAPLQCECGHQYGAFDFLEQGVRQHGLTMVNSVFELKNSTFFQVNPSFVPVCPTCNRMIRQGGGWYDCDGYGGCCCCAAIAFPARTSGEDPQGVA
jgi:hypothetical protein